jgi:PTH2 family peptidyl-tRNA hydrolase
VGAFIEAGEAAKSAWVENGMPKVVLKGENEGVLWNLLHSARRRNIPACLIEDAGRTVVPVGTITCLGLGPASVNDIDELTGALKLLR